MRIEKVTIGNFRAIKNETVENNQNALVLIGKNNSGKSAFLDALKIYVKGHFIFGKFLRGQLSKFDKIQESIDKSTHNIFEEILYFLDGLDPFSKQLRNRE